MSNETHYTRKELIERRRQSQRDLLKRRMAQVAVLGAAIGSAATVGTEAVVNHIRGQSRLLSKLEQPYNKVEKELKDGQINPNSVVQFHSPKSNGIYSFNEAVKVANGGDVQTVSSILAAQEGDLIGPDSPLILPKDVANVEAIHRQSKSH